MAIATVNPTTGEILKTFEPITSIEIEAKLELAEKTFRAYTQTSMTQRGEWLLAAADILEKNAEKFGKIMTLEMGKTLSGAIAEAKKLSLIHI